MDLLALSIPSSVFLSQFSMIALCLLQFIETIMGFSDHVVLIDQR